MKLLDNLHKYLQLYCIIEVVLILLCVYQNAEIIKAYFVNLERLNEWQVAGIVSFHAASVGLIKLCLESINIGQGGKDER